jgi:protein TonB
LSSYRGTADPPDKVKAIAAVIAVHAALAFAIFTGLNVDMVKGAVESLKTFDIREPPPPPPEPPPPPKPRPEQAKKPEGAPAKRAEPSPVVAPPPRLPLPSPIPAAKVAGTGSASSSGAAASGPGRGAGGAGTGTGGGGAGSTPARMITKIPDTEYGRLSSTGIRKGNAGITFKVNTDGSVTNCRIARSSGDPYVDQLVCQLAERYIRFIPARDPSGRPVAQDVTYFPNWWRR